jgi:hypothetical protein
MANSRQYAATSKFHERVSAAYSKAGDAKNARAAQDAAERAAIWAKIMRGEELTYAEQTAWSNAHCTDTP